MDTNKFNFDFNFAKIQKKNQKQIKRDDLIIELREYGFTYKQIGDLFGLSRQRVQQIYSDNKPQLREKYWKKNKYESL